MGMWDGKNVYKKISTDLFVEMEKQDDGGDIPNVLCVDCGKKEAWVITDFAGTVDSIYCSNCKTFFHI